MITLQVIYITKIRLLIYADFLFRVSLYSIVRKTSYGDITYIDQADGWLPPINKTSDYMSSLQRVVSLSQGDVVYIDLNRINRDSVNSQAQIHLFGMFEI